MKIVHCLFSMGTGGAQVLVIDMLNTLCANHETYLIVVNKEVSQSLVAKLDKRVRVHFIGRTNGSRNPIPIIKLNWLLKGIGPDVVHCHEFNMGKAIKYVKVPKVYTVHDVGIDSTYFKYYSKLTAISRAVKDDVFKRTGLECEVVYNGIPFSLFKNRTSYTIGADETFKIVQLSRLIHTKKGQDVLLNAIKLIISGLKVCNLEVDIVGSGSSLNYLQSLALNLGIECNIRFVGEKDRDWVLNNLCSYHLLVQPSRYEGFGLTVIEAFAAGVPVVASNIDGPKEILSDVSVAFLFESENIDDCSRQIIKVKNLYRNSDSLLSEKINSTRQELEAMFSIEATCNSFLQLYSKEVKRGIH